MGVARKEKPSLPARRPRPSPQPLGQRLFLSTCPTSNIPHLPPRLLLVLPSHVCPPAPPSSGLQEGSSPPPRPVPLPPQPQCLHLLSPLLSCRDPYVRQPFWRASRSPLHSHLVPRHPTLPQNWTLASPFHTWGPSPHKALLQLQPSGLLQPQKLVVPHATFSVTFCTGLTPSKKGGLSHCIPAPETLGTDLLPRSPFLMVSSGV